MNAKTDAEAMFKKSKPALESRLDEEARRIENMSRLRNLRLARDKPIAKMMKPTEKVGLTKPISPLHRRLATSLRSPSPSIRRRGLV
jgi:hypothetical protein